MVRAQELGVQLPHPLWVENWASLEECKQPIGLRRYIKLGIWMVDRPRSRLQSSLKCCRRKRDMVKAAAFNGGGGHSGWQPQQRSRGGEFQSDGPPKAKCKF